MGRTVQTAAFLEQQMARKAVQRSAKQEAETSASITGLLEQLLTEQRRTNLMLWAQLSDGQQAQVMQHWDA